MKVELCSLDDQLDLEIYNRSSNPFPAVARSTNIAWNRFVPVFVHSEEPPLERITEDELNQFRGSIYENNSESAGQYQNDDLKIYKASSYWYFHQCSVLSIQDFEALAKKSFPRSFLWLLCECATMLRSDVKELYSELILVENVIHRLYIKQAMNKSFVRTIPMNEW